MRDRFRDRDRVRVRVRARFLIRVIRNILTMDLGLAGTGLSCLDAPVLF